MRKIMHHGNPIISPILLSKWIRKIIHFSNQYPRETLWANQGIKFRNLKLGRINQEYGRIDVKNWKRKLENCTKKEILSIKVYQALRIPKITITLNKCSQEKSISLKTKSKRKIDNYNIIVNNSAQKMMKFHP